MKAIKMIIFDMDGLLIDSEYHYSLGWEYAMKQEDVPTDKRTIESWVGQGKRKTIDYLMQLTKSREKVDNIVQIREEYIYRQLKNNKINTMPFAREVLCELKKEGYRIGLASSTHKKRAKKILEKLDLLKYIDYSCFGDEVEEVKPKPDIYKKVLLKSKFSPDEVIAVEDSYSGAKSASNAGISVIVIPYVDFELEKIKSIDQVIGIEKDLKSIFSYIV